MNEPNRTTIGELAQELKRLPSLSVTELAEKYLELFGEPSRSRNKPHLIKKIAWQLQAARQGGLSSRAIQRIADLGDRLPERWQRKATERVREATAPRDARLPAPGTVLTRVYDGAEHSVTVLEDAFEYRGETYRSLSKIATLIAGSKWNGFAFFKDALTGEGS